MNIVAIVLAGGFLVLFLVYQAVKSHAVTKVSNVMNEKHYDEVLELTEKPFYRRMLGNYVCELYTSVSYTHLI